MSRNVVVFGKDGHFSVEQTIASTGRWPEFTWREPLRIQPLTVRMEKDYLEFMPGPVQYRELMRFRLQRNGQDFYGETEVILLHNQYTLANSDRCIWHGYSMHDESAFNAILNDSLHG